MEAEGRECRVTLEAKVSEAEALRTRVSELEEEQAQHAPKLQELEAAVAAAQRAVDGAQAGTAVVAGSMEATAVASAANFDDSSSEAWRFHPEAPMCAWTCKHACEGICKGMCLGTCICMHIDA